MARRTPKTRRLPLLLLLLLSLDRGGALCQSRGGRGNCSVAEKEVNGLLSAENIHKVNGGRPARVYVKPNTNFKGVAVKINDNGQYHNVWFQLKDDCFPGDYDWWELFITTKITWTTQPKTLGVVVLTGGCFKTCTWKGVKDGIYDLTVVAYGPSEWRVTPPPGSCRTKEADYTSQAVNKTTCTGPPPSYLTPTRPPSGRQPRPTPRPVLRPQTPGTIPEPPPTRRPPPSPPPPPPPPPPTTATPASTAPATTARACSAPHEYVEASTVLLMKIVIVSDGGGGGLRGCGSDGSVGGEENEPAHQPQQSQRQLSTPRLLEGSRGSGCEPAHVPRNSGSAEPLDAPWDSACKPSHSPRTLPPPLYTNSPSTLQPSAFMSAQEKLYSSC